MIVYEDEAIRIVFKPGSSDFLLVTFGDAITLADGLNFYASAIVDRFAMNCLRFMAKSPNWFPDSSITKALSQISYTIGSFTRIIIYGCSMGGYAALKYSRLLRATNIIAQCPQWSIDPAECGSQDSGFSAFFNSSLAGMGIKSVDLAGTIDLLYDPQCQIDAYHSKIIASLSPQVKGWHVHNAGHHVTPVLAGTAIFASLLAISVSDDKRHMYAVINSARRKSAIRSRLVLSQSVIRHPQKSLRIIRQMVGRLDAVGLTFIDHFAPLIKALVETDSAELALNALTLAAPSISDTRRDAIGQALERAHTYYGSDERLFTVHGTQVAYDALHGRLVHSAKLDVRTDAVGVYPVVIHLLDDRAIIGISIKSQLFGCHAVANGVVDLMPLPDCISPDCFYVSNYGEHNLHVSVNASFLCTEPGGAMGYDRLIPDAWETFSWGSPPKLDFNQKSQ